MMGAIAESPRYFGRGFRWRLQRRWHLGFGSMRRLRKRAQQVFGRARQALERRRGVGSLWDLLD
jgi:hypothetical protein